MPRRAMRKLHGGETERLTQNYWSLRAIVLDRKSSDEDISELRNTIIPAMNEDELAYTYWEYTYMRKYPKINGHVQLVREYLLTEFTDRLYHRGRYKEK